MAFGKKKEERVIARCSSCYETIGPEDKICPVCGEATIFMSFADRKQYEVEQWKKYREEKAMAQAQPAAAQSDAAPKEDLGEIEEFKRVPLLRELSVGQMRALAKRTTQHSFTTGQDLIRQGDTGGPLFLILEGKAQIIDGGRVTASIGPGDFVGEITVIDGGPRTATVRAETDIRALAMEGKGFLALLEENWLVAHKVLIELCSRLRELQAAAPAL